MIRTFVKLRRFVYPYWRTLCLGVVLSVVDTALDLAKPWPLKIVVDNVLKAGGGAPSPWFVRPLARQPEVLLALTVAALLVIVGLSAVASYSSTRFMAGAGERIGNDVRADLFAHLQRLSLRFHGRHEVGELTARVTADVDRVQDMLVDGLSGVVPNALLVAGMVAIMVTVDPMFATLALAASPVMAVAIGHSVRDLKRASREARRFGGRVASAATEGLGAIQVVQALSLEDRSQAQFRDLNRASLNATLEAVRFQARIGPAVDIAAAVSTAAVFWFGAHRVLSGRISVGVLIVFVSYVGSLYRPIRQLAKFGYTMTRGTVAGERIVGTLAEDPDVRDEPGAQPAPRFRGEIRFDGVGFSYGREPVLRDIRLTVRPGEVLAVVGATGAGKSTLLSLIPRLFDVDRGSVRIDGVDVRRCTVRSLRSQIAVVLQDSVLFSGTLWDNIACGDPAATVEVVRLAAQLALVDEFAQRLPEGYETVIGERGVNLSGGQRQRVAIARALVRDAPILILDEPTSALDAGSERLVIEALQNLMRGRTTIVVAHRLSTVRSADRIVVMARGRIAEEGTHDALVEAGGVYAALDRLQRGGEADGDIESMLSGLPDPSLASATPNEVGGDVAYGPTDDASGWDGAVHVWSSKRPILYVLKRFPRLSETFVLREILMLEALGERILIDSLLQAEPGQVQPEVERLVAQPRYLPKRPALRHPKIAMTHARVALRSPLRWVRLAARARRAGTWHRFVQSGLVTARIRKEHVRHVHAHFATAAAEVARDAAALAHVPVTISAHAKDIFHEHNAPLLTQRLKGVAGVVTVSEFNAEHLRSVLPETPVHHVPNGVALAAPEPPSGGGPVLCVSRLVPKKGIDVLIDAAALARHDVPDLEVEIIGGGSLAEELERRARMRGLGGVVRFLGPRTWDEVDRALRRCSMFVLPCRVAADGDRDGMPTALVEAAARGVPVISTRVAGIPELVLHDETGLLVPPDDPVELASAITRLLRDRWLAERLGAKARALVAERFDPRRSAEMLREVFEAAAG